MRRNLKRLFIEDRYNKNKTWEIVYISHGIYLRQYIYGRQYGKGCRITKKWLKELDLLNMKPLKVIIEKK